MVSSLRGNNQIQISNVKIIPNDQNSKPQKFEIVDLEFIWSLEFENWYFG